MRMTRALAALTLGCSVGIVATSAVAGPAVQGGPSPCADATVRGTDRGETLRGTPGPDVIDARGGDDRVLGLGGDDLICGGGGQDVLLGGAGDDVLHGGTDAKVAEDTDYYVYYGDTLEGGPGDDVLDPGADDRHRGSVDAISFDHADGPVRVDLAAGTASGDGADTIVGRAETLTGSAYDDVLRGSDRPEILYGGAGSDVVDGRGGNDWVDAASVDADERTPNVLRGGSGADDLNDSRGDDLLIGGPGPDGLQADRGRDRLYGGPGNDMFTDAIETPVAGQVLDGGTGRDNLGGLSFQRADGRYEAHTRGVIRMSAGTTVARFDGVRVRVPTRSFELVSTPFGDRWTVYGTPGNDEIIAGGLDDPVNIHARAGNDRIFGSNGDDLLDGGPGRDTGSGWTGHDRIISLEKIFRN